MCKTIKKAITISIIVIIFTIAIIASFYIIKHSKRKSVIENVCEIYSNENINERLSKETDISTDSLSLKIDGETIIGVVKIDKINYEGLVSKGTSLSTLENYVGHFENTPYLNGNVCLAAHNTNKFWAKLHTLQVGDKITYTSFLGTKEYSVTNVSTISETDWSVLDNTNENTLTLITCVKGQPNLRLCVQALEKK